MAKRKFDGVVECVRYKPNGEVDWVRAYERRGAIFTDHLLIKREALIQKLKSGKKFVAGSRVKLMASTFEIGDLLRVIDVGGKEFLVTDDATASQDHLEGIPVI
ncbi:MAG: hypothetical protein A2W36_00865 [Chloroflexi bacterium RBG_16_58_14]|nr:MAG: hypothetical protein A2W36_00865 [Chloroflexi bacterium RBG_16_58_14]